MTADQVLQFIINWDGKEEITTPPLKHVAEVYKNYMGYSIIIGAVHMPDIDFVEDEVDDYNKDTLGVMKAIIGTEFDDDEIKC